MFGDMFGGFNSTKLKAQLKMAGGRIQIASNKKGALLKQNMREVAVMLAEDPPKEEKAMIRAEALIRDDNLLEAFEILQLQCELLYERIKLIESTKECPPDLAPVVASLMWASQRLDIPELLLIRKQFRAKYGKKFEEFVLANTSMLNERVVAKLSVEPPAAYLVHSYLEQICEKYEVDWKPRAKLSASQMAEPTAVPIGYSVAAGQGTGLGPVLPAVTVPTAAVTSVPAASVASVSAASVASVPAPSVAAGMVPPMAPGFKPGQQTIPQAPIVPPSAPAEAEIYVDPPPPTAPTSTDDGVSTITGAEQPPKGSSANDGSVSDSYADLAARFNQLKKF